MEPDAMSGTMTGFSLEGASASLSALYDLGGPVVGVLLALSVLALAAIFICALRLVPLALTGEAREKNPGSGRGPLKRLQALEGESVAAIEAAAIDEASRLNGGLRFLELIAQVAPLLGLFGTVIGMIDAFRALEAAGGDADPSALAGGIWVALLTTAVGLSVAIPVQMAAQAFSAMAETETARIEALATRLAGKAARTGGSDAS